MSTRIKFKPNACNLFAASVFLLLSGTIACVEAQNDPSVTLPVGALLPFSGEQAAVGLNIEQAISLAIRDVNEAGGVNGRPLVLHSRDSNSGSDKGYEQAIELLVDERVRYLIGPEENGLAQKLIPEIKQHNVLNILPGIASPTIEHPDAKGAWIRLAPTPSAVGCAMAYQAIANGHNTAVTLVAPDDYQLLLSTSFNSHFAELGGEVLGAIRVNSGQISYWNEIDTIADLKPDLVLLLAYPQSAAAITRDWVMSGREAAVYLGPTLYTDVFLNNAPFGSLEGFKVFAPALSLKSECNVSIQSSPEWVNCKADNNQLFSTWYESAFGHDTPLPSSRYYYDAVVLLALSLARAAWLGEATPSPTRIREHTRFVSEPPGIPVNWQNLATAFKLLSAGKDISYSGAAAEYEFNVNDLGFGYGIAKHSVIDAWDIINNRFTLHKSIGAYCVDKME